MYMTVRQLREKMNGVDDDTCIVVPAFDHSYRLASVEIVEAEKVRGGMVEYAGEDYMEDSSNPVVKVLLVS